MAIRKLKPIEDRDPYAKMVMEAFDSLAKSDVLENNAINQSIKPNGGHHVNANQNQSSTHQMNSCPDVFPGSFKEER